MKGLDMTTRFYLHFGNEMMSSRNFGDFATWQDAAQFLEGRGWRRMVPPSEGEMAGCQSYWRKDDKTDVSKPCWTVMSPFPMDGIRSRPTEPVSEIPEDWIYPEIKNLREKFTFAKEREGWANANKNSTICLEEVARAKKESAIQILNQCRLEKDDAEKRLADFLQKVVPWHG